MVAARAFSCHSSWLYNFSSFTGIVEGLDDGPGTDIESCKSRSGYHPEIAHTSFKMVILKWSTLVLVLLSWFHLTRCSIFPSFVTTNVFTKAALPDLYEASVLELQGGLQAGHFTSVDLVKVRL